MSRSGNANRLWEQPGIDARQQRIGSQAIGSVDADTRTPDELMASLRDMVRRARAGRLRSSELSESTITVTSLGDRGVDSVRGVIYPPQVALIGFGRVADRPWVADHTVVAAYSGPGQCL